MLRVYHTLFCVNVHILWSFSFFSLSFSLFFLDICYYKKVCPFSGSTPMIHSNVSDFHFSWNQMPNAIGR